MPAIAQPLPHLRPFTVIGFSVSDEVLCPTCLPRTTPITGERLSHACRRGPRPVPDAVRKQVLALDEKKLRPGRIADELRITLPTVMRVLSGDDADAGTCPACEASKRSETREILPLYYADTTVRDELCNQCGHTLVDLAIRRATEHSAEYHVEHTTIGQGYPALQFDRRPPEHILRALKDSAWRWRPGERVWIDYSRAAEVPTSMRVAPKPGPLAVLARPPIIRRCRDKAPAATSFCRPDASRFRRSS